MELLLHVSNIPPIFRFYMKEDDINQHLQSQKDKEAERALASSANIGSYFVTQSYGSKSRKIAAIKAVIAYQPITVCVMVKAFVPMTACINYKLIETTAEPEFF